MRIGELLVQQGLITPAQLDAGLRTQEQYGGRLVSTLVELSYLDGDVGTRALAKLRKVPAALQKHFDAAEPSAIARIPRKVAEKYSAVPLGWAGEAGSALILAMLEPTDLLAVEEMRFLAGAKLVPGIALEVRIRQSLNRWYGVPLSNSRGFISMGGAGQELETVPNRHVVPPSQPPPPQQAYRPNAPGKIDLTIDMPPSTSSPESGPQSLPPFVARKLTPPRLTVDPPAPQPAQRRASAPPLPREDPDEQPHAPPARPPSSSRILLADEAIERISSTRGFEDRVEILVSYLRGAFEGGVVFAVRNDIAFSWKAFGPGVKPLDPPKIAVPLTQPSVLVLPYEAKTTFFGTPSSDGSELNARIWKALGAVTPREALALPIVLDDKVAAIVYAHPRKGERIAPPVLVEVANVCAVMTKR
jgi:hypothetical protein